jgi:L-threonylcarbamoyladenylate synthase
VPIAAPSANTSGRPSPTNVHDVLADLCGKIDAVLDTGACTIGVESTVVDCTTPVPTLLRPGGITLEMLVETLGEVEVAPTLAGHSTVPRAPGMKYTHYAPNAPMILVEGVQFQVIVDTLHHEMTKALAQGKKVGAIVSSETAAHLPCDVITVNIGSREDVNEIAANLYTALRYFDDMPVDIIYAEGISETGIGLAVMNRLRKASGYCILDTNTRS